MIEPTEEMIQAFNDAEYTGLGNADWDDEHLRIGLAAVLALVERDYRVEARCVDADCARTAGHGGDHGWFDGREWVTW